MELKMTLSISKQQGGHFLLGGSGGGVKCLSINFDLVKIFPHNDSPSDMFQIYFSQVLVGLFIIIEVRCEDMRTRY